jgi:hypothetical protein
MADPSCALTAVCDVQVLAVSSHPLILFNLFLNIPFALLRPSLLLLSLSLYLSLLLCFSFSHTHTHIDARTHTYIGKSPSSLLSQLLIYLLDSILLKIVNYLPSTLSKPLL